MHSYTHTCTHTHTHTHTHIVSDGQTLFFHCALGFCSQHLLDYRVLLSAWGWDQLLIFILLEPAFLPFQQFFSCLCQFLSPPHSPPLHHGQHNCKGAEEEVQEEKNATYKGHCNNGLGIRQRWPCREGSGGVMCVGDVGRGVVR